jgi:hypothetical protein
MSFSTEASSSSSSNSDEGGTSREPGAKAGVKAIPKAGREQPDQEGRRRSRAPKRHKPGKKALTAAAEMSQLLNGYVPPPISVVLLNNKLPIASLNEGVILTIHASDLTAGSNKCYAQMLLPRDTRHLILQSLRKVEQLEV